ncbi:MAG: hypothetical protein WCF36_15300 [Candidatus Nanopelagicales bacterium]
MPDRTITGDYRPAKISDVKAAAWITARAYTALGPGHLPRTAALLWAAWSWPINALTYMLQIWSPRDAAVYLAPAHGRPRATVTTGPHLFTSRRRAVGFSALLGVLLFVLLILGLGWVILACAALAAPRFLLAYRFRRVRPLQGQGWPARATCEIGGLAAWPPGAGRGARLFADVFADLRTALPDQQMVAVLPARPALVNHYQAVGFRQAPGTPWMVA